MLATPMLGMQLASADIVPDTLEIVVSGLKIERDGDSVSAPYKAGDVVTFYVGVTIKKGSSTNAAEASGDHTRFRIFTSLDGGVTFTELTNPENYWECDWPQGNAMPASGNEPLPCTVTYTLQPADAESLDFVMAVIVEADANGNYDPTFSSEGTDGSPEEVPIFTQDPCDVDPTGPGCVVDCNQTPTDPRCQVDCDQNPTDPRCQFDCDQTPTDPRCQVDCDQNPTDPRCQVNCDETPMDPRCLKQVDCTETPDDPECQSPIAQAGGSLVPGTTGAAAITLLGALAAGAWLIRRKVVLS